jgi:hypothetical protein
MNCKQARNAWMLHRGREPDAGNAAALNAHLEACATCREEARMLAWLVEAEKTATPLQEVRASTVDNILRRAESELRHGHVPGRAGPAAFPGFFELWRPALLYGAAALLLIVVLLPFLRTAPTDVVHEHAPTRFTVDVNAALAWDPDLDDALYELETLLAFVGDESRDALRSNGDLSLDELAAELLELEGWSI